MNTICRLYDVIPEETSQISRSETWITLKQRSNLSKLRNRSVLQMADEWENFSGDNRAKSVLKLSVKASMAARSTPQLSANFRAAGNHFPDDFTPWKPWKIELASSSKKFRLAEFLLSPYTVYQPRLPCALYLHGVQEGEQVFSDQQSAWEVQEVHHPRHAQQRAQQGCCLGSFPAGPRYKWRVSTLNIN